MKILQTAFLSLFIISWASVGQAQVPELIKNEVFRRDARAAVDSLYNFNPEGAEKRLSLWKEEYPDHPLWQLMDGMEFWWLLLSDLNDTSRDDQFFEMMKKTDYAASKLLYNQPGHVDALIMQTVANGYIARQYSNRDEWVTSLNAARKAYKAYGYLQENTSDLPDLKLADGMKLYYSEYLPEEYPVVKTVSWFLPEGDKTKGLKFMQRAAETAIFAQAEAKYFLGNINFNYEKKYGQAVGYFEQLYATYPRNNYYARLLVKNYYKVRQYNKALSVINNTLKRWQENELPFGNVLKEELLFWKGRIFYRNGNYGEALPLFREAFELSSDLPRSRHRNYYAASAYYAGAILSVTDKNKEAATYFNAVLDAETGDRYKNLARNKLENIGTAR